MKPAFKEWAVVCEALGTGRQSLIIRKGGIAEGREGFAFKHEEFFLFPTWFHEQIAKTRLPPDTPLPPEPTDEIDIAYIANLDWSRLVTDREKVNQLREYHIWQDSVVDERFEYDEPCGVHVALVRVYRLDPPVRLKLEKKYGGCRSWVELPELEGSALVSVISDEAHAERRRALERILDL
ncbi:MAG TPA: DUF1802 family protein [Chthoniobacterales bacterium]